MAMFDPTGDIDRFSRAISPNYENVLWQDLNRETLICVGEPGIWVTSGAGHKILPDSEATKRRSRMANFLKETL